MRIKENEAKAIVLLTQKHFGDTAQVWLFGSRVDDLKKGGDIDLYIETDLTDSILMPKIHFLSDLDKLFLDQKIDLLVQRRSDKIHPLGEIAKATGIHLPT